MLCVAPCLLLINQRSRVEYIYSAVPKATRIRFESVFINVNLTPERLCLQEFRELLREHHIDKPSLFMDQNDIQQGLLPLLQTVFDRLSGLVAQLQQTESHPRRALAMQCPRTFTGNSDTGRGST